MSLEFSPARETKAGLVGHVERTLISDRELADLFSISRTSVWRRVADGTLPQPIKIGGLSRFVLAEVGERVEAAKAARTETEAA